MGGMQLHEKAVIKSLLGNLKEKNKWRKWWRNGLEGVN